jgi:hypothetical protein
MVAVRGRRMERRFGLQGAGEKIRGGSGVSEADAGSTVEGPWMELMASSSSVRSGFMP